MVVSGNMFVKMIILLPIKGEGWLIPDKLHDIRVGDITSRCRYVGVGGMYRFVYT